MSGLTSAATQYTSASTAAGYVYNNQATKQPSRQNFVPSFLCCSINENEDGGILRGFDDILKLLIRRIWLLQFRCQVWDRLQETVLDCFDGAGTSTLVAHQMGRRFIGIELSPKYHALTTERHEQITRGEDPFGKQEEIPTAKNSRVERLTKQKYEVSKKVLQLEVRLIANRLGHIPSREEVERLCKYPIEYFDEYFFSWGEVCAAARHTGMSENNPDSNSEQPQLLQLNN